MCIIKTLTKLAIRLVCCILGVFHCLFECIAKLCTIGYEIIEKMAYKMIDWTEFKPKAAKDTEVK